MSYSNLTSEFFKKFCKYIYLCGNSYLWIEEIEFSSLFLKVYRKLTDLITVCIYIFISMQLAGLFTQPNLTEKQYYDRFVLSFCHPVTIVFYLYTDYYKNTTKEIIFKLAVVLKNVYNDKDIERQMLRKSKLYSVAILCNFSTTLISYGFDGLVQVACREGTFTTVITAWPDVEDRSVYANIGRVATYIVWWLYVIRLSATYLLMTFLTICLSYQYKNLQSYFYNLEKIFDENELSQFEKEKKYERSVKIGIKLHSETNWCVDKTQTVLAFVFNGQIMINVVLICTVMLQMANSERTISNALATVTTGTTCLVCTGFFMWFAGDITVEAGSLSTAIYSSGWENCEGDCSARMRRLLVFAITQSQKPVVLRSFGIVDLSYQSFVTIVKASYSVFSLLY
ncbi:unnamed protein product [Parnassius mnemosyne]|uniref:Odorant receptor n=1 Tax=Parnassius mnemosyne TaxID=213953 RepID=A0AAV1LSM1_9NEOP